MKALTQLRELNLNLGQLTDQDFQTLLEFKWLQTVGIAGDPKFDDTRLMRLSEITDLKFVYFDRHCIVSPKGIENFRAARPDVLVNDGVQVYPATVPAKAEGDSDSAKATPPGMEPSSASTPLAAVAGPVDYEAERKAAEWVLSVGGSLGTVGVHSWVVPGGQLPDGEWQLHAVSFADQSIQSVDLEKLASCRNIKALTFWGTDVGDAGCAAIGRMANLEDLVLYGNNQITNAGVKSLGSLQKLRRLALGNFPLSDEAMDVIAGMTELRSLDLVETPVTDVGFKKLATLVHLEENLVLPLGVTDQGLSILGNFPQLKKLGLYGHQITDSSIAQMQKIPKLTELYLIRATDENLLRIKGLTQLQVLQLNLGQLTEQGFQTLQEFKWLQNVAIWGDPKFDDTRLMSLSEITDLKFVYFDRHCIVSPKGIENFRAARPDVRVNDGVQDYPATVPATAEDK